MGGGIHPPSSVLIGVYTFDIFGFLLLLDSLRCFLFPDSRGRRRLKYRTKTLDVRSMLVQKRFAFSAVRVRLRKKSVECLNVVVIAEHNS